jgi:hypothetical protein
MTLDRRRFLRGAGSAAFAGSHLFAQSGPRLAIVLDPRDPVATAAPARWAAEQLRATGEARGLRAVVLENPEARQAGDLFVLGAGPSPAALRAIASSRLSLSEIPESLAIVPAQEGVLACGRDVRALVYALLELADRVRHAENPVEALQAVRPVAESPANRIRSVARCFTSDVEDKPWYNDRAMWPAYLGMLAAQRFNRFSLTFGIGYDFIREVSECYFHFAYPFLVSVPGYDVRASGLPEEERDANLAMLRLISNETAARGLEFQLGLWTHAYDWAANPNVNYTITGLTPERHAAYCRDALQRLLEACPAITGVTFRIHGESGVPEGSYDFWKTVFDGIVRCGRRVAIDMHAKGMDFQMIEVALATGMPVTVSPKYWAEHMGLPYHQAAIRELEMPREAKGFFALSSGARRFLRYGYGDLLREDRRYGVLHRIWPGTQRVLLWGDPEMAAAYGRESSFCGSDGVELFEPLSFKGRKGSGLPGGRCAYADSSLNPHYDWEKYEYTYWLWGRLLYNPDSPPETWRRLLSSRYGKAAPSVERALASASRILPLVTTAHGPSGANNSYWPEMYTNMPTVDASRRHPYSDTPAPKRFGAASPFDPELFATVDEYAAELLSAPSGKYSAVHVATWLAEAADTAARSLAEAERNAPHPSSVEFRRLKADVDLLTGLGRFFAWKFRSALLYALYEKSGDRKALAEAVRAYRAARAAWADLSEKARGVYRADVTFGYVAHMRGHWADRLAAIDADLADMEKQLAQAADGAVRAEPERVARAIAAALGKPTPMPFACRHDPPLKFRPGDSISVTVSVRGAARPDSVRLHYRRVNQAERWRTEDMIPEGQHYRAVIPAEYTGSPYPLQYYFTLRQNAGAWIYPGFNAHLCGRPYFVVRQVRGEN